MQKHKIQFLKKVVTYLLILAVSVAYNIETVNYLLKVIGDSSNTCVTDFQCKENDSEEKESEKCDDEKKIISIVPFINSNHFYFNVSEIINLNYIQNYSISSSDFQKEIYSPPEL